MDSVYYDLFNIAVWALWFWGRKQIYKRISAAQQNNKKAVNEERYIVGCGAVGFMISFLGKRFVLCDKYNFHQNHIFNDLISV